MHFDLFALTQRALETQPFKDQATTYQLLFPTHLT